MSLLEFAHAWSLRKLDPFCDKGQLSALTRTVIFAVIFAAIAPASLSIKKDCPKAKRLNSKQVSIGMLIQVRLIAGIQLDTRCLNNTLGGLPIGFDEIGTFFLGRAHRIKSLNG